MATLLRTQAGSRMSPQVAELRKAAEQLERLERGVLAQLRDDLIAAGAREAVANANNTAARLNRAVLAAQRLQQAFDEPTSDDESAALEAVRELHHDTVRYLTLLAVVTLVLLVSGLFFVVSR